MDHPNLILAFRGVVPLNVGSRDFNSLWVRTMRASIFPQLWGIDVVTPGGARLYTGTLYLFFFFFLSFFSELNLYLWVYKQFL